MQLECISRYQSAKLSVEPGQVLDLSDEAAAALLADSPGSWRVVQPASADETDLHETETKALDEPTVDKMVKRPARSK